MKFWTCAIHFCSNFSFHSFANPSLPHLAVMAGQATTVAPWISALRAEASTRKKHVLSVINGKLSRANIKQLTKADRHHLQELYDEIDLGPRPGQPTISAARARKYRLPAGISNLEVPVPAAPPPRVEAASASTRAAAPSNIPQNPTAHQYHQSLHMLSVILVVA